MESEIVWEKNNRLMTESLLAVSVFIVISIVAIVIYYIGPQIIDFYLIIIVLISVIIIFSYETPKRPFYYSLTNKGIHFKYLRTERTVYWKDIQDIGDVKVDFTGIGKVTGLILKNGENIPLGNCLDQNVVERIRYGYDYYKNKTIKK